MKVIQFRIERLPEDPRLDKAIPLHEPSLSRNLTRKLIESGAVYLNQKRCQRNAKEIKLGDKIKVVVTGEVTGEKPARELFTLTKQGVLFENDDIIVVNKPPHLPTHGTIDSSRHHLAEAVETYLKAKSNAPKAYVGIHHRLDLDTSGIILFTKRKEANAPIAQAFQERTVEKTYLALCLGAPKEKEWTIRSYLGPSSRNKRIFCSVKRDGKYAETQVKCKETLTIQGQKVSLMEAKPKTGRTHQIRVHLSEQGLPLLGDKTYGVEFPGVSRVMLHAWKLELLGFSFLAPLPEDFRQLAFHEPKA